MILYCLQTEPLCIRNRTCPHLRVREGRLKRLRACVGRFVVEPGLLQVWAPLRGLQGWHWGTGGGLTVGPR